MKADLLGGLPEFPPITLPRILPRIPPKDAVESGFTGRSARVSAKGSAKKTAKSQQTCADEVQNEGHVDDLNGPAEQWRNKKSQLHL